MTQRRTKRGPLVKMTPLTEEETPTQLKTRRWRIGEPGWEGRPAPIESPYSRDLYRAPNTDVILEAPLPDSLTTEE